MGGTSPQPEASLELQTRDASRPRAFRWFWLAFLVYAVTIYGSRLRWWAILKPTQPHHHVAQAQAWLAGRLSLDPNVRLQDLSPVEGVLHSSFPPGPTILLLVPVALFGDQIPDLLLHCILAAASVGLMHGAMWRIARRLGAPISQETLQWLTVFYALGTIIWLNVAFRGVWFLAHWVCLAALTLSLCLAARGSFFGAGLGWAFAFASRPPCVGALPALVYLLWQDLRDAPSSRRRLGRAAAFLLPPVVMMALWMGMNHARFGSPLDFGRSRMITPYADRLAKGVFATVFLGDNLRAHFLNPPRWVDVPPYLVSRHEGTGLLFTTPAFLCLLSAVRWGRRYGVFWLASGLTLLPLLLHHANESGPAGARHLLDMYPLLFVLLMLGIGSRVRWWAKLLISVDVLYTFAWVWYWLLRW